MFTAAGSRWDMQEFPGPCRISAIVLSMSGWDVLTSIVSFLFVCLAGSVNPASQQHISLTHLALSSREIIFTAIGLTLISDKLTEFCQIVLQLHFFLLQGHPSGNIS